MTFDASTLIAFGEGTALPAARSFGETNTLTWRRARTASASEGLLARALQAAAPAETPSSARVSVVAADPDSLTITF